MGGYDYWELVDTKTITEDTSEYIYTFDSEKYDDVLVVGTEVNGNKRMAFQIRFKNGNNRVAIASNSITLEGQSNVSVWIKFVREKNDLYYLHENFVTETTTTTSKYITNQNYVNNKIESVRINAATNYTITSGTFKIYGKVRSEFL